MLVTVSAALLFGAITTALVWTRRVSFGTALAVWLSGFTVAGTGLAAPVNQLLTSLATALGHH